MKTIVSIDEIEAVLPQTQCGLCGYPGCRPYAEAIVQGEQINRCPPGGLVTLAQLAKLTNQMAEPLQAELQEKLSPPKVAFIREEECIGCTKCIQACPVDAILGAAKQMHVVLQQECTGCNLCVAPCPVDCIEMHEIDHLNYDKNKAKKRYQEKLARGAFKRAGSLAELEKSQILQTPTDKKSLIAEAIARAKARRQALQTKE